MNCLYHGDGIFRKQLSQISKLDALFHDPGKNNTVLKFKFYHLSFSSKVQSNFLSFYNLTLKV